MRYRKLPVLGEDDRKDIDRLRQGLDQDTARVLAYLLRRQNAPDIDRTAAGRLEIQFGTGLGRDATIQATNKLAARDLIATTHIDGPEGRPQRKGWTPVEGPERTVSRVLGSQASQLRNRGLEIASRVGAVDAHSGEQQTGSEEQKTGSESNAIAVALNWEPNAVHFPVLVAMHSGAYNEARLAVSLSANPGSGSAVEAVLSGQADLGVAGPATVMRAMLAGEPLVPLALLYQRSMVVLYSLGDRFERPFDSIEQLSGRRLAVASASETGLIARVFLSQAGVTDSIEFVQIGGEERDSLLAGEADVAAGVFTDPLVLRRAGHEVDSVLIAEDFPIPGPAIVTDAETARSRPEPLDGFLEGTIRGWAQGVTDPGGITAVLQDRAVGPVEEAVIERLVQQFGTDSTVDAHGWGWQTDAKWDRVTEAIRHLEEDR